VPWQLLRLLLLVVLMHIVAAQFSCLDTEFMTDVRKSGQWCSTTARDADPGLCERHYASTFTSTARQQRQRCVHNGAKCVLETPSRLYQCPIKDSENEFCRTINEVALGNNIPPGQTRNIWCGEFNGPNVNEAFCRDITMQANGGAGLSIPGIVEDTSVRFYSYETCKYDPNQRKCVLPRSEAEVQFNLCKTTPLCLDVFDVATTGSFTCREQIAALLLGTQIFASEAAHNVALQFPEQCGL